jgi:hypothetical protein
MKVYLVLVELAGTWAEGEGAQQSVTHRFLDATVESALGFRGKVLESRIIERRGECQIGEEPLAWEGK